MGLLLLVGGVFIDGEGSAGVGEVASIGRADVDDEEFAGLSGARARGSAALTGAVVVSHEGGHRLAGFGDGGGAELVEEFDLGEAGPDDLPGAGVHGVGAGGCSAEQRDFVGVFPRAKLPEGFVDRFDGDIAGGGLEGDLRRDDGGVDADAFDLPLGEPIDDVLRENGGLLGAEGGEVAGLVEVGFVDGAGEIGRAVGGDEMRPPVGKQDQRGEVEPERTEGGEVVNVLRVGEDDRIECGRVEAACIDGVEESVLPVARE